MKKKIMLFLMASFLGISFAQNAIASGQLISSISEYKTYDQGNCTYSATYNCSQCQTNMNFVLNWFKTAATNGQWTGTVNLYPYPTAGSTYSITSNASVNQGTWPLGSYQGKYCLSQIQQTEQSYNNVYQVSENFTPTNGNPVTLYANNALIINSSNISPNNMTLTPDPINIATGEDYFSSTDFSLSGRGPKLALFRKYRSFSTFIGMFGYGWRTDFDINLSQDSSGDVTIYDAQGTAIYFMNNSGTYVASPGNYSTLVKNTDNTCTLTDKYGIVTHYDINGRLLTRTDRNGNVLSFVYNPAVSGGTYIQDASGRQIVLYFTNGYISSAVDPAGKTYTYGYDGNGNLNKITDPTMAVTSYTYDSNHRITQFTNANGHNTYYQYNTLNQVTTSYRDNNVNQVNLTYQLDTNDPNSTSTVIDSLNNKSTYVFNPAGLLISYADPTDPPGVTTQQSWDPFMNRTSITDARGNTTNFTYDTEGNLLQISGPLNKLTNLTYTSNFNLLSSKSDVLTTSPLVQLVTNFNYDNNGNLTSIVYPSPYGAHSFVYDQYGNVITATDGQSPGNSTYFAYDAFGHVIQNTNALGNSTNFTFE